VSSGVGLWGSGGCGGGNDADCSSSGNWAGDSRTLIWALPYTNPPAAVQASYNSQTWQLVMKLTAGSFCYGSSKWTDGVAYNEYYMEDDTMPDHATYDAKSAAFHTLSTSQLRFQVQRGSTASNVVISFASSATPENLMTTNDVAFASYPSWSEWTGAYGIDRARDYVFMRGGSAVYSGASCRQSSTTTPSGCGQACMFCYQAADGSGCNTGSLSNDVSSGVGLWGSGGCGGGNDADCSSSGNWAGDSRTLIWALV